MRRIVQRSNKSLKDTGWSLLKDRDSFKPEAAIEFDFMIARVACVRTAQAWLYKGQLPNILECNQLNVVRAMLLH